MNGTGIITIYPISTYIKMMYLTDKGIETNKQKNPGHSVMCPVFFFSPKHALKMQEQIRTCMYRHIFSVNCTMQWANRSFLENYCFNQRLITSPVTIATWPTIQQERTTGSPLSPKRHTALYFFIKSSLCRVNLCIEKNLVVCFVHLLPLLYYFVRNCRVPVSCCFLFRWLVSHSLCSFQD